MTEDLGKIEKDGWLLLIREPQTTGPYPLYLLLHGWTGDEHSMWIFASRLPRNALLAAPRGLFPALWGGYGWQPGEVKTWASVAELEEAALRMNELLSPEFFPNADLDQVHLVGFSQGAALAFTMLLFYPQRVRSISALSGFLPEDADRYLDKISITGKPVFWAHGTRDELVPVERARSAIGILEQAGARVVYCEDDVGHKLSASCFRGLEAFNSGQVNC